MTRLIPALLACAVLVVATAAARSSQLGPMAFDGGGSGGGNPLPPNSVGPIAPTFMTAPGRGPLQVTLLGAERRLIVVRDRTGRLLDLAVTDERGRAVLAVLREGGLLDVVGSEVIGLPVAPGVQLAIALGPPEGP